MQIRIQTTKKQEMIDLTIKIGEILKKSKIKNGLLNIYTPHSTAAVIINENHDPNICKDILNSLNKLIPEGVWLHDKIDNNAAAHIKASILGPSETIPIREGKLQLGIWQSPMLVELDGPKERTIIITMISN